jgi:hypothetical protein
MEEMGEWSNGGLAGKPEGVGRRSISSAGKEGNSMTGGMAAESSSSGPEIHLSLFGLGGLGSGFFLN